LHVFDFSYLTAWLCEGSRRYGFLTGKDAVVGIDESLIKEIVRRILSAASPNKIILFESAATGLMIRNSMVDAGIQENDVVVSSQ